MKDNEIRDFVSALTKVAEEYGQTQQIRERIRGIVFPFIEEARRTVSGQEAVAVVGPRIGDLMANPIRWTDMKAMDSLPIGTKLYAAPIPRTVSGQEAERDVRDFQRELAQYFEDVGDPHGAVMIRNFADLSGYAAPIPATEQTTERGNKC